MKTILTLFSLLYFTSLGYSQCATDTIPPIARCANITLQLSTTGVTTLTPIFIDNQSTDNCGIDYMLVNGQSSLSFTCADIGINPVALSVVDAFGNSSTCTSNVTVMDTIAPVVNCYNPTMQLSSSGVISIVPISISNSSDNCFISSKFVNGQTSYTFTCADIGINPVVLSVTDLSGNSSTCVSNVTVMDTVAPVVNCQNITLPLSNSGYAVLSPQQINNGSSDNCGILSFLVNGQVTDTFDCSNVGLTSPALLTVTDFSGNSSTCLSTVTVMDTTAPIAMCQNINLYLSNNSVTTVSANQINSGSFDNCGILSTFINGQNSNTFDCSDVGMNPVVLSVVDLSGNMDSCSSTVTVMDTIVPIANCQNVNLYLSNTGIATVSVNQINNASTDNCGINSMLINGQNSLFFSCADIGVNSVTLQVLDASANSSTCLANVTVMDTVAPIISCRDTTLPLSNTGYATLSPQQINNGSSDNCGILSFLINGQATDIFDCTDVGLTIPAILTVTDFSGNSSTCLANVTVLDPIAPIASCRDFTLNLSSNGIATVSANQINNGSIDNCGILSTFINSDTFDCSDVGMNTVVLSVTDLSGNVDTCSSIVTITDSLSVCALSNPAIHQTEESIDMYPNPTAQILTISSKESLLEQITLTSITGQVVLTQNETRSQSTAQLDLSNLPNAVYLITVITNKGISTQKIVVQH